MIKVMRVSEVKIVGFSNYRKLFGFVMSVLFLT
jgi:hypothetical protein